jgi:hypothetical protein
MKEASTIHNSDPRPSDKAQSRIRKRTRFGVTAVWSCIALTALEGSEDGGLRLSSLFGDMLSGRLQYAQKTTPTLTFVAFCAKVANKSTASGTQDASVNLKSVRRTIFVMVRF